MLMKDNAALSNTTRTPAWVNGVKDAFRVRSSIFMFAGLVDTSYAGFNRLLSPQV